MHWEKGLDPKNANSTINVGDIYQPALLSQGVVELLPSV